MLLYYAYKYVMKYSRYLKFHKSLDLALFCFCIILKDFLIFYYIYKKKNRIKSWNIRLGNLLISFVHSLGEGTRPTRGHTKSASISASHRSSSGVPPSDHSLLDPQPRNAHNSLLATADPLRQRYRPPMPNTKTERPAYIPAYLIFQYILLIFRITFVLFHLVTSFLGH